MEYRSSSLPNSATVPLFLSAGATVPCKVSLILRPSLYSLDQEQGVGGVIPLLYGTTVQ